MISLCVAVTLGEVEKLIGEKYSDDAATLVSGDGKGDAKLGGEGKRKAVGEKLKEIKGHGPLDIKVFFLRDCVSGLAFFGAVCGGRGI
jgi:hypothetical protein